jgi:hypothetical protein
MTSPNVHTHTHSSLFPRQPSTHSNSRYTHAPDLVPLVARALESPHPKLNEEALKQLPKVPPPLKTAPSSSLLLSLYLLCVHACSRACGHCPKVVRVFQVAAVREVIVPRLEQLMANTRLEPIRARILIALKGMGFLARRGEDKVSRPCSS